MDHDLLELLQEVPPEGLDACLVVIVVFAFGAGVATSGVLYGLLLARIVPEDVRARAVSATEAVEARARDLAVVGAPAWRLVAVLLRYALGFRGPRV